MQNCQLPDALGMNTQDDFKCYMWSSLSKYLSSGNPGLYLCLSGINSSIPSCWPSSGYRDYRDYLGTGILACLSMDRVHLTLSYARTRILELVYLPKDTFFNPPIPLCDFTNTSLSSDVLDLSYSFLTRMYPIHNTVLYNSYVDHS